jgi:hypothetical protein
MINRKSNEDRVPVENSIAHCVMAIARVCFIFEPHGWQQGIK